MNYPELKPIEEMEKIVNELITEHHEQQKKLDEEYLKTTILATKLGKIEAECKSAPAIDTELSLRILEIIKEG